MGNFEKLSVLVIVVIIVMILVVALYTLTEDPEDNPKASAETSGSAFDSDSDSRWEQDPVPDSDVPPVEPPSAPPVDPKDPAVEPPVVIAKEDDVAKKPVAEEEGEDAGKEWFYVVKSGDTLGEIAMNHLHTMTRYPEIVRLNPGVRPETLQIGMKLKMPAKGAKKAPGASKPAGREFRTVGGGESPAVGTGSPAPGTHYVTKHGDQLQRISKLAYGTIERWPDIYAKNFAKIDNPELLRPGTRIFLPE